MTTNPYRCSATTPNSSSTRSPPNTWGMIAVGSILVLGTLLISVLGHYALIDDPTAYRNSAWIGVELICLLLAMISLPLHGILAIHGLFNRSWKQAAFSSLLFVATGAIVVWAMWYDAATIVYAT